MYPKSYSLNLLYYVTQERLNSNKTRLTRFLSSSPSKMCMVKVTNDNSARRPKSVIFMDFWVGVHMRFLWHHEILSHTCMRQENI